MKKHGKINLYSFVNKKAKNIKFHEWLSCVGETSDGKLIASDNRFTVCNVDMKELSVKADWKAIPQSNKNEVIAGDSYKYFYGTLQYNPTLETIDVDYFIKAIDYGISLLDEFDELDPACLIIGKQCCYSEYGKDLHVAINKEYFKKFQEYMKNGILSVEILSNGIIYLKDKLNGSAVFTPYYISKNKMGRLESGINEVENFYIIKL